MERHHVARIYWGIFFSLLAVTIVSLIQVSTALNPVGIVFDSIHDPNSINTNFNVPSYFDLFPPLDIVNAPTIQCTLATGFIGVKSDGSQIALSVPTTTIIPTHTFDLASTGGTTQTFNSFIVREGITCPVVATSFPPNLASGKITIAWTGAKKDGTQVNILTDTENIQLQSKDGNTIYTLPSGTTPLSSVYLYQWAVSKSQIENAIGVNPLGDNFNSLQNIAVTNSLVFYQGNVVSVPWSVTNVGPSQVSYNLHEITGNPVALNNLQMVISVLSPTDSIINPLQNTNTAKIQLVVTNWSTGCGGNQCNQPQMNIYFTDPTSTNQNTPIFSQYLTPDAATGLNNGVTTFTFTYTFGQTVKAGQYTFAASMTGNPTVAKTNVIVKPVSPPSCPIGQYFDSTLQVCKSIATKQCSDGSVISASMTCPTPTQQQNTNLGNSQCQANQIYYNGQCQTISLPSIPYAQILTALFSSGQQSVVIVFVVGLLFFVFLIVSALYHGNKKRNGEEGIPSIIEVREGN